MERAWPKKKKKTRNLEGEELERETGATFKRYDLGQKEKKFNHQ